MSACSSHELCLLFADYQEVNASSNMTNVVQHNWGGMATPVEYDVPKCSEGVEGCAFENGHWVHRFVS